MSGGVARTAGWSNLAHIPWAVGLQLLGVVLLWLAGVPLHPAIFWVCGLLAWVSMFTRDEAKEEFTWIETKGGGKRANMPDLVALKVWNWGRHNLLETGFALAAVVVVSIVATVLLLFVLR